MATKKTQCKTCGADILTHSHYSARHKKTFLMTEKNCLCDINAKLQSNKKAAPN